MLNLANSIRFKVTAAVLLAVLSATLIGALASAWREASRRFEFKRDELKGVAATLAAGVAPALAKNDRRQVAVTLNAIGRIPGLKFARVVGANGELVYQFGNGVVVTRDGETTSQADADDVGPYSAIYLSTFPVVAPIISAGSKIGRIDIIADISELKSALVTSIWHALFAGILAGFVGVALSWRLQLAITRPISRLTAMVEHVGATGDYTRSVPRLSNDETGRLVDAFNGMVSEIRTRDDALSRHRDRLEEEVRDRTRELTVAKQKAEAADAAKSDFLATMSHEIRTPMNGMLVMAELLAASGLSPKLQRYSDIIVRSGQSLVAIINDILDLSKIQAGKMDLETISVDPSALVDDVLKLFSERASSKNLDLAGYVAPDVPETILADPVRLNQVLSNLVNNALKFTQSGGVTVSLTCLPAAPGGGADCKLRFAVNDTGIGIAKDKIATIFTAFSQADQSTTRNFGGTGIGLTISQKLVSAMGSEIRVTSDLGAGSQFAFECVFPIERAAGHVSTAQGSDTDAVLLLLPDGPTRWCLERYIRDAGMTAATDFDTRDWNEGSLRAVIADPATLSKFSSSVSGASRIAMWRSSDCQVIVASDFGDTTGDRLVTAGSADVTIDRPLSPRLVRDLLMQLQQDGTILIGESRNQTAKTEDKFASFAGARVLAADDSAVNREVLIETLSRLNVQVTSVNDGAAAVEAARSGGFDLIFMDGSMPGMDGFAAARAIREIEAEMQRPNVPIIALTAHVLGAQATRWRDVGMNDHVSKPFTLKSIQACLERWLSRRSAEPTVEQDADNRRELGLDDGSDLLIDGSVLEQISEIQAPGDDLVVRILGLYLEHAPVALDRLAALAGSGETAGTAEAAHALKSLSRNVGACRVAALCETVEAASREGQQLQHDAIGAISTALSQTLLEIARLRDAQGPASDVIERQRA